GGTATIENSIVANCTSGGNCYGAMKTNGYNLSSENACNFNSTGDLNNPDPKLGNLANHGRPPRPLSLLTRSPAIDAWNPSGCTNDQGHLRLTDQPGSPDHEDTGNCDMGVHERQTD